MERKSNHEKITMILLIIVSVLLIINLFVSLDHINKYQIQKRTGDDKWQQVRETLDSYDNRIEGLERRLDNK